MINALKAEKLKVWYSIFCVIMDEPTYNNSQRLEKLWQLRQELSRGCEVVVKGHERGER